MRREYNSPFSAAYTTARDKRRIVALSNFLQCPLAQKIGIAFAGLGKFNDALGHEFVGEVASVCKPEGRANHLEGNAHNARRLGVEGGVIQKLPNGHDATCVLSVWGKPRRRSRLRGGGSERGTQKGRRGNATGGPVFRRTAMRLSQLKENAGVAIRYGAGRYPEVQ